MQTEYKGKRGGNKLNSKGFIRKILAVAMSVVCLMGTGCGKSEEAIDLAENTGDTKEQVQADYSEKVNDSPRLTIGYTFWDLPIEGILINQANQIKLVADALGVDLIFNENTDDLSPQSAVDACRRYADMGVDGMIVINFSEDTLLEINDICKESKIPFIQATRTITDSDVADVVEANEYYVGRIHEDEYTAAYTLGRKLVERGSKNIVMLAPEHGDAAYEARAEGFRDACEEPDVNIIEEVWELGDADATSDALEKALVEHPETDGIFTIRCGFMPYIIAGEDAAGVSEHLPVVGVDFDKSHSEYFADGTLVAAAGGHHADASLSLITLVNAIRGAYDKNEYPLDINNNMMLIDGQEQFEEYCKWCLGFDEDYDNRQILNANEARALCVDYNPDTTLENIRNLAGNTSLEDVKRRHAGLVD